MRTTRGGLAALALGALMAATLPTAVTNAAAAPAIAANPVVEFVDGIIRGNLNITGTGSQQLRLQFVSGSKGGKRLLEVGCVIDDEREPMGKVGAPATDRVTQRSQ